MTVRSRIVFILLAVLIVGGSLWYSGNTRAKARIAALEAEAAEAQEEVRYLQDRSRVADEEYVRLRGVSDKQKEELGEYRVAMVRLREEYSAVLELNIPGPCFIGMRGYPAVPAPQ